MCSKSVAKIILVIFNFVFFAFGATVLGLGCFIYFGETSSLSVLTRIPTAGETVSDVIDTSSYYEQSAIVLIVAGAAVFLIGFCGCCGAYQESKILLIIYAVLVFIILAVQIAGGVLIIAFKGTVDDHLENFLNTTIHEDYEGSSYEDGTFTESTDAITAAWDFAQTYFECCGAVSYEDYASAEAWNNSVTISGTQYDAVVPVTCCKQSSGSDFPDSLSFDNVEGCLIDGNSTDINSIGCYDKIHDYIIEYGQIVGGVAIGVALAEIFGIIFACVLIRGASKSVDIA